MTKSVLAASWSTVGKKFMMAVTGLALVLFITLHLLGNLTLYSGNPNTFNLYSHKLESFGVILYVIEVLLAAAFLFHMLYAVAVTLQKWAARPTKYYKSRTAGDPSHMTLSSKTMIWTGLIIIVFTVIHVITFKYGPGIKQGMVTTINGVEMRDLRTLVINTFQNAWMVVWYVFVMILLFFHLRHGFWSAFQSLGWNNPRVSPALTTIGVVLAILLGAGFLSIPVYIYFAY